MHIMACVISGEERKDEMKTEKKKQGQGKKKVKGGIHPCIIKGREEEVVRRIPVRSG
jgi:hypothetical protein